MSFGAFGVCIIGSYYLIRHELVEHCVYHSADLKYSYISFYEIGRRTLAYFLNEQSVTVGKQLDDLIEACGVMSQTVLAGCDSIPQLQKFMSAFRELIYTEEFCVSEMFVDGEAVRCCNCYL